MVEFHAKFYVHGALKIAGCSRASLLCGIDQCNDATSSRKVVCEQATRDACTNNGNRSDWLLRGFNCGESCNIRLENSALHSSLQLEVITLLHTETDALQRAPYHIL